MRVCLVSMSDVVLNITQAMVLCINVQITLKKREKGRYMW